MNMLPQVDRGKPAFPQNPQQAIGAYLLTDPLTHTSPPIQTAGTKPAPSSSGIAVERERVDQASERNALVVSNEAWEVGTMSLLLRLAGRFLAEASASVLSRPRHPRRQ